MRNNWNLFIVCFLCVLCFQPYQVNAQTQSQKKITIEISNERLPSVLKRLEKLSGYKILFTYDDVKKFTVSGSVKDKSIEQTLDIILANKPLEYHIEDQFITITSKGPSKQAKVFNVKGAAAAPSTRRFIARWISVCPPVIWRRCPCEAGTWAGHSGRRSFSARSGPFWRGSSGRPFSEINGRGDAPCWKN